MALTKIPASLLDTSSGFDLQGNITLGDSEKILLGASSDLQIYHDESGGHSRIDDTGTGGLVVRGSQILLEKYGGGYMINAVADGASELYHAGNKKFETTSTGATVTGNLAVTGDLDITGDINSYNVTDLDVTDKTITLGAGQTEANSGGSGIIIDGSSASILWDETNDEWDFNKNIKTTGTVNSMTIGASGFTCPTSQNFVINSPNGFRVNIDSNNTGTQENFVVGNNQTDAAANNILFKINEAGKASIGHGSANANLHIGSANATGDATNPALQIGGASTYRLGMYTSTEGAVIANANGDDGIQFVVKTAGEAMRIDGGTGNVGIGTDNPAAPLHVIGNDGVQFNRSGQTNGFIIRPNASTDGIRFTQVGTGDRMTIMTNGGVEIGDGTNYGYVKVINDSAVVQYLDRRGTDGAVLEIRHADSKDGQINTLSGRMAIGSGDTGIFFDSTRNCISPFDMSTNDGINATIDIGRTGVRFNNAFLEKVTIEGTSNDEGIYLGTNHRIYGGTIRAFETSTTASGTVSLGEGMSSGKVLISAPELMYPEDLRFKDDNGILRFTKTVAVGESATTVLTITKSSYSYFVGGTITFILVDSGSPWGIRTQTYSISGRVATFQAGDNMGVSYSLIKETANMDYTPTLSTVDTRTTGQNGGTYVFKFANGSGNGSSNCKVIFDGYFAGGTLS